MIIVIILSPCRPGNHEFTPFSCTLNEHEAGVAPTDSRFRPDQRIMEEGDFTKASEEKVRMHEYTFVLFYTVRVICKGLEFK